MSLTTSLQEQATALERDALALRKLVEAAEELGEERVRALLAPHLNGNGNGTNGHSAEPLFVAEPEPAPEEDVPRGREAVRLIVHARPGLWTLTDLRAEMKRCGFFTSNKGVDVAVTRMVRSGEARRVGKGRYEFFAPATEERDAA